MNTPVSFEIAKLLKEKGFDNESAHYYNDKGEALFDVGFPSLQRNYKPYIYYDSPIIADVVMWLYEKHGIWIRVTPIPYSDNLTHWRWEHMSTKYATRNAGWKKQQDYLSPTEAYEAAIEYTLNNLI